MAKRYEVDQFINHIRSASEEERYNYGKEALMILRKAFLRQSDEATTDNMLYTLVAFYFIQAGVESFSNASYEFCKFVYESPLTKEEFLNEVNKHWEEEDINAIIEFMRGFEVNEMDALVELGLCLYVCGGEFTEKERYTIYGLSGVNIR